MSEASEHIQFFRDCLDAPVSSTGQAPHVRHDGKAHLIDFNYTADPAYRETQTYQRKALFLLT